MPLQKVPFPINFAKGLDTKSDPYQLAPGNFIALENTVFNKTGALVKRNGYGQLASLPNTNSTFLTTYNGNLTAVGTNLNAYSSGSNTWVSKGNIQPVSLSTSAVIRNNLNQTYADTAIAENNLACTVYAEYNDGNTVYKYVIADSVTGQNIVAPALIPGAGVVTFTPKVFLLGRYFMILFDDFISGIDTLAYIAINTTALVIAPPVSISNAYTAASTGTFDGIVCNNNLYLAWNNNIGSINVTYIDSNLVQHDTITQDPYAATLVSICADQTGSTADIYVASYNSANGDVSVFILDQQLNGIISPVIVPMSGQPVANITCVAQNGSGTIICEFEIDYSYVSIATDFTGYNTVTRAGVLGDYTEIARSVGLASKAFLYNDNPYFLTTYSSPIDQLNYQPTYFLLDLSGQVIAKIAYQNGGPYLRTGLPSVVLADNVAHVPFLFKDLIQAVNKNTNVPTGSQTAGIYSQTGINLAEIVFGTQDLSTVEIGKNLMLTGGFLGMYDGYLPVENNFFLYPENIAEEWTDKGGNMAAQPDGITNDNAYYYQVTYEWTDNQGNAFKSAPSIPIAVTTTGTDNSGMVTLDVPTLRLTYKLDNPVKIVIYRWSVAQQIYYQVTSLTSPILNDVTMDSIEYVDTLSDEEILGNNILYTTGGVVENIAPPATSVFTLFQSRLFMVDAEDQNLLLFSKQVIESVPVEMSDLLSIYVAPTAGSQGDTGPIKVLAPLDDKLIIFKQNAIYYITGVGPDNTGANSQFSEPVFITSTVGSANPNSIVFMPNGIMFQSDKGIWLLDRSLNTSYIGAPVEAYNNSLVQSAINIAGTNQVRFTLDSGVTLMYDYFFAQWGTFINVPAISSTLYQGLHTYINSRGEAFQESPGLYLDGSNPVLLGFTTGWFNLMGLQGYQRAYFFLLLGTYLSPHKLQIQIAYDYKEGATQTSYITPDNYAANYGGEPIYGDSAMWGGASAVEQWRVFFNQQKCESFQIKIQEIFDSTKGVVAGAGLTLSGLNLVVGAQKGYYNLKQSKSVG